MASQAFMSPDSAPGADETPRWAWWLLLLIALCTLVVGVLLLLWPHRTLSTLAVILGIYLLAVGAIWVGVSLVVKEVRGASLWRGVLALLAGVIVIRHPSGSLTVLALAFGVCLLIAGVFGLVAAFESSERRGWRILEGLVDLAIGILVVSWPQFGVFTFAVVLGISLIVRGVVEAGLALTGILVSRGERRGRTDLSVA
jgi:drug/metabolite transporter (DMT)-like permease